jgi:endonuclease/exonuclease/phosphatase family metal-dependent hydrolase
MPALNEFDRGRNKNDFPAILVGDFNADPESAPAPLILTFRHYKRSDRSGDAWPGPIAVHRTQQ